MYQLPSRPKVSSTKSASGSFLSSVYRTPELPPPEELKLLQLWVRLLDFIDLESQTAPELELRSPNGAPASDHSGSSDDFISKAQHYAASDRSNSIASRLRRERGLDRPSMGHSISSYRLRRASKKRSALALTLENRAAGGFPYRAQSTHEALWSTFKDDHPDEILSRHLRHEKWDVDSAFKTLVSTLKWRGQVRKVDEIVFNGEHGAYQTLKHSNNPQERKFAAGFLRLVRVGTSYCRGVDKQGRPVLIQRAQTMHSNMQPLELVKRFILLHAETLRLVLPPSVGAVVSISANTSRFVRA